MTISSAFSIGDPDPAAFGVNRNHPNYTKPAKRRGFNYQPPGSFGAIISTRLARVRAKVVSASQRSRQ